MKIATVIFSHLSDIQKILFSANAEDNMLIRINFIKLLVNHMNNGRKKLKIIMQNTKSILSGLQDM